MIVQCAMQQRSIVLAETEQETRALRVIALWALFPRPSTSAFLLPIINDETDSLWSPLVMVTLLNVDREMHDSGERFSNRHLRMEERSMAGQLGSVGSGSTVVLETLLFWVLGMDLDSDRDS